ncbi:MAG: hypothetical protein PHO07_19390, partial [Pirellulales bacterium]|nr:hypothetical protein [Pirellulales bacterium]
RYALIDRAAGRLQNPRFKVQNPSSASSVLPINDPVAPIWPLSLEPYPFSLWQSAAICVK